LSAHDKVFASTPPAPLTAETLDSRVRRLSHILASCRRDLDTSSQQTSEMAALQHFSTTLPLLQQLTAEVRSRLGNGDWDSGDTLAARLLLDAMTSAVRSCRVVTNETTSRLIDVERTVNRGHTFVRREEASGRKT
jgi:hypothetical protein